MTEVHEEVTGPAGDEDSPAGLPDDRKMIESADGTLLQRLRERRAEMSGERKPYEGSIPGYGDELVGHFRALDWKELRKIAERVDKSRHDQAELLGHLDTIINSCIELFVKKDGRLVPLAEVLEVDEPVRFDHNLVEALKLDRESANSARKVARDAFPSDLSVTSFYNELAEWMQDFSKGVDEDFLGESRGE